MYPTWEGLGVHSTMFVAVIAAFHVIASHLTVGAAWFNFYVERRAYRENRPELYQYLRKSAMGLLVFSYVWGAMTGVGIWQSTTAGNPRGISTLIHNFVLFWGSEWYMFLIDVVGIIVYYYTLEKVDPKTHLRLAFILALGGTGTLSLIVGIHGFKLSPGKWLENGEVLSGFYNPTFWPQYFMRFALMQAITGAWAILMASRLPRDFPERRHIIRWAGIIGLVGLAAALLIGRVWYWHNIPARSKGLLSTKAFPAVTVQILVVGLVFTALGLLLAAWRPSRHTRVSAIGMFFVLFTTVFGAERTREILRKPDVVNGYISSNQLVFNGLPARGIESEEARLDETGILGHLPFVPAADEIDANAPKEFPSHEIAVGRQIAIMECSGCHSVSDQTVIHVGDTQVALRQQSALLRKISANDAASIRALIDNLGTYPFMHDFVGNDDEKDALAAYLEYMVDRQQGPPTTLPPTTIAPTGGSHGG